jgi:hypothetical protein
MALSPNRVGDVYVAITARNLRQTPVPCVTSECFGVLDQVCEARYLKCLGEKLWPRRGERDSSAVSAMARLQAFAEGSLRIRSAMSSANGRMSCSRLALSSPRR